MKSLGFSGESKAAGGRRTSASARRPTAMTLTHARTMARAFALFVVCTTPLTVAAADDVRVRYIEQELRNVQRELETLRRRVDQLTRPVGTPSTTIIPGAEPRATGGAWVDAAKWQRVRTGMGELEVIELLGPPTSMREENGARVLYYAMEIGASGFLGGSVTLRDRKVVEVRKPELQ